ncbi:MAG: NAD(P)-binding domain-containing protein [Flavobacteriales bacterium]|nr:NAD(P)-binding domain-containing protein [Flavobacteriales bacterium]
MKALIIDDLHSSIVDRLESQNIQVDINTSITRKDLISSISQYDILLLRSKFQIDKEVLDVAANLKVIARAGAGMEKIDMDCAKRKGIVCLNSPEGNRVEVAEQAIGMLLNLMHKIRKSNEEVRKGKWDRNDNWGTTLAGKTIGIIGYGNMGSAFASRLSGFDVNILAYDKYKRGFGDASVQETSLEALMSKSDIISIHLPLSEETNYYVDKTFFSHLKKKIILLNTARGKHVRLLDLLQAIELGSVEAAALDVLEFENENFEGTDSKNANLMDEVINHPRILVTPHVAGWTHEAYFKHSTILADKILDFL